MIRSLLWKEFREQRWRLLITLALFLIPATAYSLRLGANRQLGSSIELALLFCVVGPIWLAAWVITGESVMGTRHTFATIPASPWILYFVKSGMGAAALFVALIVAGPLGSDRPPLVFIPTIAMTSLNLYVMTLALAMGARRGGGEGLVAMIGIVIMLLNFVACVIVELNWRDSDLVPWFAALDPITRMWDQGHLNLTIFQLAVCLFWWLVAGFRFVRQIEETVPLPQQPAKITPAEFIPEKFLLGPLAWKERREQLSLLLGAGFAGLLVAAGAGIVESLRDRVDYVYTGSPAWRSFGYAFQMLYSVSILMPSMLAIVLGVSTLATDLDSRVMEFWRGRPIPTAKILLIKCATAIGGIFALQALILALVGSARALLNHFGFADSEFNATSLARAILGQILWLPAILVISMFWMALLRRSMYATACAAVTMIVLLMLPCGKNLSLAEVLMRESGTRFALVNLAIAALTLVIGACTLAALKRDSGRRPFWKFRLESISLFRT